MTFTSLFFAIVLAVLALIIILSVAVPAVALLMVHRNRDELRQNLDAFKAAETRTVRPARFLQPDRPERDPAS